MFASMAGWVERRAYERSAGAKKRGQIQNVFPDAMYRYVYDCGVWLPNRARFGH
jgi:hypothetical protein